VPPKYIYRDATTCAQYAATLQSWRCRRGRPRRPPHSPPRRWLTDGAVTL